MIILEPIFPEMKKMNQFTLKAVEKVLFRKYPSHDLPLFKYRLEIQTKIFLVSSVLAQTCRPHHRVAEIVSLVLLLNALLCCTVGNQAYFVF